MKCSRRVPFIVCVLAGTVFPLGALAVACSSSSTSTATGPDASSDGTAKADVHVPDASTVDHSVIDTGPDSPVIDAGRDSPVIDAGRDSSFDAGRDAAADVSIDTGRDVQTDAARDALFDAPHDSGIDVHALLVAYPNQVNTAYCQQWANCCGNPSNFNVATCVKDVGIGGGIGNVSLAVIDSGNIAFDPSAASNCLATINALPCPQTTAAENLALINACAAAMQGTLNVGETGCRSSWDCKQPGYCDRVGDAGTGTCTAILGLLQPCKDSEFSQDCTSLGNAPGAFCGPHGATSPTCLVAEKEGGVCDENAQCNSTLCYNNCVPAEPFGVPGDGGTCGFFP